MATIRREVGVVTPREFRELILDAVAELRKKITIATPGYYCGPVTIELDPDVAHFLAGGLDFREQRVLDDTGLVTVLDDMSGREVTIKMGPRR